MNPQTMPLDQFHWNKDQRTLTAFASDFGPIREGIWWMHETNYGQCIIIRNRDTGKQEQFKLVGTHTTEGDIQSWLFLPMTVGSRVVNVTIYND